MSGWIALLALIPLLAQVLPILLLIFPSNPEGSRFDQQP
jgi:hypothetical protein